MIHSKLDSPQSQRPFRVVTPLPVLCRLRLLPGRSRCPQGHPSTRTPLRALTVVSRHIVTLRCVSTPDPPLPQSEIRRSHDTAQHPTDSEDDGATPHQSGGRRRNTPPIRRTTCLARSATRHLTRIESFCAAVAAPHPDSAGDRLWETSGSGQGYRRDSEIQARDIPSDGPLGAEVGSPGGRSASCPAMA